MSDHERQREEMARLQSAALLQHIEQQGRVLRELLKLMDYQNREVARLALEKCLSAARESLGDGERR